MTVEEYKISVKEIGPRLLQFAMRHLGDIDLAKDIVEESFIVLLNSLASVEKEKVKSYLFTVANNKIKDHFKLKKNTVEVQDFHQSGSKQEQDFEKKEIVQLALSSIDHKYRELIILRDLEGYSYDEIAIQTQLSLAQVKVYIFRARKAFKEQVIKLEIYHE